MKKYDVFLCYSRHNLDVAESICKRLKEKEIAVFFEVEDIVAENFASAITENISNSRFVLYLHSEYSIQSNWIRKELEFAIDKGLTIIPVNVGGFRFDDSVIRKLLYDRYWLEYNQAAYDHMDQFEKLVYNILRLVNPVSVNPYGGIFQRPEPIQSVPSPSGSVKEEKVVKSSRLNILFAVLLVVVTVLAVVALGCENYVEVVLLVVAGIGLIYLLYADVRYSVRIHNTDARRTIIIRVDGEEYCRLVPLGMKKIEKLKGEHVISAQVEDEQSDPIIVNYCFNKETDGKIIPISFVHEQNKMRKSDLLKYRCFIAGSTSITNERNAARAVLSILYNQYEKYDFYITAHTYEDFNNKHKIDGHQYDYDTFIMEKADCTIFIICNQVGDKTLKEYDLAIATNENTNSKRPAIFVYNDLSCVNDVSKQDPSVFEFRKLVDSKKAYWRDYTGIDMLMLKIKEDISAELTDVLEMRPSVKKDKLG